MYKYEFERITSSMSGWGPFNGNDYRTSSFHDVINERAAEGWRYVGFVPVSQRGTGHISEMDLVFEKEIKE